MAARIARVESGWLEGQTRRVIKNGRQEATGTGNRQPGQAGGDKGRLESDRIYSQNCIRLTRRACKKGYEEWQARGNRERGDKKYRRAGRQARRAGENGRQGGQGASGLREVLAGTYSHGTVSKKKSREDEQYRERTFAESIFKLSLYGLL